VGQPKQPREENGKRRKLAAARSLDNAMMAILAAVYSSIEIRTLDDWYSQPAAVVIRHGANRRDEGKSRPRPRIGRTSWQPVSRFWQRLFSGGRLRWNSSLEVKWSLAAGMLV